MKKFTSKKECLLCLANKENLQKISHVLCHKGNLNKCQKSDIQIVFSQQHIFEINHKK